MSEKITGTVVQVTGPVLDVRFEDGKLPGLNSALEIDNHGQRLVAEVAQHIGDNTARCIAMSSTDNLVRGTEAVATGAPISVPVGEKCLGRMFNLLGEPIDEQPSPETDEKWAIHRPAPSYEEQESETEILETGIRSLTLYVLTPRAVRSACLEAQVSERLSSLWSLSITSPHSTAATAYLPA